MSVDIALSAAVTLAAVAIGAILSRVNDHRRWTRDQKLAVYREVADAIFESLTVIHPIAKVRDGSALRTEEENLLRFRAAIWRLQLVCSETVSKHATDVFKYAEEKTEDVRELTRFISDPAKADASSDTQRATVDEIQASLDLCVAAMRKDLGIPLFAWKGSGRAPRF